MLSHRLMHLSQIYEDLEKEVGRTNIYNLTGHRTLHISIYEQNIECVKQP